MRNNIGITCLFLVSVLWSQSGVLLDVYDSDGVDMFHRDVLNGNTFKIGIMRKPFYDNVDTLYKMYMQSGRIIFSLLGEVYIHMIPLWVKRIKWGGFYGV